MTADQVIDAITENLIAERKAVIALDAEKVAELGEDKDRLVTLLASVEVPRALAPRLVEIVTRARHNCQLLAHARDALRGAATIVASTIKPGAISPADLPRRGMRVSITG